MTVCGLLETPSFSLPKVRAEGAATAGRTPVPDRLTKGVTLVSVGMARLAARAPVTGGVKEIEMVQLAPAAKVFGVIGHVVVSV